MNCKYCGPDNECICGNATTKYLKPLHPSLKNIYKLERYSKLKETIIEIGRRYKEIHVDQFKHFMPLLLKSFDLINSHDIFEGSLYDCPQWANHARHTLDGNFDEYLNECVPSILADYQEEMSLVDSLTNLVCPGVLRCEECRQKQQRYDAESFCALEASRGALERERGWKDKEKRELRNYLREHYGHEYVD